MSWKDEGAAEAPAAVGRAFGEVTEAGRPAPTGLVSLVKLGSRAAAESAGVGMPCHHARRGAFYGIVDTLFLGHLTDADDTIQDAGNVSEPPSQQGLRGGVQLPGVHVRVPDDGAAGLR